MIFIDFHPDFNITLQIFTNALLPLQYYYIITTVLLQTYHRTTTVLPEYYYSITTTIILQSYLLQCISVFHTPLNHSVLDTSRAWSNFRLCAGACWKDCGLDCGARPSCRGLGECLAEVLAEPLEGVRVEGLHAALDLLPAAPRLAEAATNRGSLFFW